MDQVDNVRGELVRFGELGNILDRTVGSVLKGVQGRKTGRGYFPQRSHQLALGPRLVTGETRRAQPRPTADPPVHTL